MPTTDKSRQLHETLLTQVQALVDGDDWRQFLAVATRFHRYSANNIFLILAQRPDATRVAGYRRWQSLGGQVRKGERGIAILAPCVYRARQLDEAEAQEAPNWPASCGQANGVTDYEARTVTVRPDVDGAQAAKTLAHEPLTALTVVDHPPQWGPPLVQ